MVLCIQGPQSFHAGMGGLEVRGNIIRAVMHIPHVPRNSVPY